METIENHKKFEEWFSSEFYRIHENLILRPHFSWFVKTKKTTLVLWLSVSITTEPRKHFVQVDFNYDETDSINLTFLYHDGKDHYISKRDYLLTDDLPQLNYYIVRALLFWGSGNGVWKKFYER